MSLPRRGSPYHTWACARARAVCVCVCVCVFCFAAVGLCTRVWLLLLHDVMTGLATTWAHSSHAWQCTRAPQPDIQIQRLDVLQTSLLFTSFEAPSASNAGVRPHAGRSCQGPVTRRTRPLFPQPVLNLQVPVSRKLLPSIPLCWRIELQQCACAQSVRGSA